MKKTCRFHVGSVLLISSLLGAVLGISHRARAQTAATPSPQADGVHDFDFELGTWRTHLRRLQHPLSGSTTWLEYNGTTSVRAVSGGRANLLEFHVSSSSGSIDALSLRLYEPEGRQWTVNFANLRDGRLTPAVIGSFRDGRGSFYGQDSLNGRAIFVRFIITRPTPDSAHFEQAFSADGGQTWEVNWIADDVRTAG